MFLHVRKPEDLKRLAVNEIASDEGYSLIRDIVEGIYVSAEVDEIGRAISLLGEAIQRVGAERGEDWGLRVRYLKLLSLLKFGLLVKLNDNDIRGILNKDLLFLLTEEDNLVQRIQFAVFVWGDEDGQRRKNMLSALADNFETIAAAPVRDWLKDYENTLSSNQRGALGIESYLSHSSLVHSQAASDEDRELLRRVLRLYDWLKTGGPLPGDMVFSELKAERTQHREPIRLSSSYVPESTSEISAGGELASNSNVSSGKTGANEQVSAPVRTERELIEDQASQLPTSPMWRQLSETKKEEGIPSPKPIVPAKFVPPPETLPIVPLQPVPQAMKTAKPAFFFDLDDEREADKHREKTEGALTLEQELRRYADEVIQKNSLAFKDDVNKRRFIQLFVSRLKDVRGTVEVREALLKSSETGGLALEPGKAEQVIGIMEAAKREFNGRLDKGEIKPTAEPEVRPSAPRQPLGTPIPPQRPTAPAFDAGKAEEWRQQMLKELQAKAPTSAPVKEAVRPQLMDVKAPPKVVGPLDELMTLSLIDLRRLGVTPTEAFHKVRAKIDLIGETSIARRIEAVKAWHMSPVYRQYLALGRESIEQEKPVAQVIAAHQALGEKVLTEAEFNAVVDFNSKLRF